MFLPFITANQYKVRKCEYCGKEKVIERGVTGGEWICPVCGKRNRIKSFPAILT